MKIRLYPKFINDQQNVLDIIISEIDKKYKILGLYLYKTKKAGIHETVESLPHNLIRIKSLEIEKLDEVFNKVQDAIIKEKGFRISSIRLFRKEAIDLINRYCERIEEISTYEFLEQFSDLIQKLINKDLILIYPEPLIIRFLKNSFNLLNNIPLQSLFLFIEEVLPEFNLSLLINGSGIKVIIHLQKSILKSGKSKLTIRFLTPDEIGLKLSNSSIKDNLFLIQKELNTESTYYINQNDILSFTSDFIGLGIPLKKDNVLFLLQKALFAYRSFENRWSMVPRPKIYNNLVRFTLRLFGFNFNLKKLSHWAIPDLIFNYIDFCVGLNSRILFIITDQEKNKDRKSSPGSIFKDSCKHSFLLEIVNSTLENMMTINKEELFSGSNNSISSIKKKVAEKYGTPTSIIVSDKLLLQNFIKNFIVNHSKLSIFPRFKTLKMLKNEKYLSIYPEFPIYKLIKKKRAITFVKLLLPVLIDKFEF